jgi:hypothetical protein
MIVPRYDYKNENLKKKLIRRHIPIQAYYKLAMLCHHAYACRYRWIDLDREEDPFASLHVYLLAMLVQYACMLVC